MQTLVPCAGREIKFFLKSKINPLLGAAGVSAVPGSAREVHIVGQEEDPTNYLLMHVLADQILEQPHREREALSGSTLDFNAHGIDVLKNPFI